MTELDKPRKRLIVEEIQSDLMKHQARESVTQRSSAEYANASGKAFKVLDKVMHLWELTALSAVKKYARQQDYNVLYLVPGHIKARNANRNGYDDGEGHDTALRRIYDEVPAQAGFVQVPTEKLQPSLQAVVRKNKGKFLWRAPLTQLKVAKVKYDLGARILDIAQRLSRRV